MNRQARFRVIGIACALLALGGCGGEPAGTAGVSDEIPRPANLDGVDQNVLQLIENGIRMIEDDPGVALPRAGLGMIYQANEMFAASRIAYRQALAIEPDNARWLYHVRKRSHFGPCVPDLGDITLRSIRLVNQQRSRRKSSFFGQKNPHRAGIGTGFRREHHPPDTPRSWNQFHQKGHAEGRLVLDLP